MALQFTIFLDWILTVTAVLRKTDVLVIDEFSMLDFFLFRKAEGLCRKFAKKEQLIPPLGWQTCDPLG